MIKTAVILAFLLSCLQCTGVENPETQSNKDFSYTSAFNLPAYRN